MLASGIERRAKLLGLTVAELCRRAGIHESNFPRWKAGVVVPRDSTIARLQAVLDVQAAQIHQDLQEALIIKESTSNV